MKWGQRRIIEELNWQLVKIARISKGKNSHPTADIVDWQSVKMTERGALKGFDGGEKIKGILIYSPGLVLGVSVTAAN
ncbi:hypothetical protein PHSC3_001980 [Chlamydiales bacterium STE3]|nr:hypothetical protein PHSC3_001980 [Chlamydiales bacterium STE3]